MPIIESPALRLEQSIKEAKAIETESRTISIRLTPDFIKMLEEIIMRENSNITDTIKRLILKSYNELRPVFDNKQEIEKSTSSYSKGEALSRAYMSRLLTDNTGTGWAGV